ncbi:type I glyceraldehyde-3-phosphate dehydrogenase, partial [Bifidobacterium adolescentis]
MTTKVGINGFGRIGRLAFRRIAETSKDLQAVALNDLTSPPMLAHLSKYDIAHGNFAGEVSATEHALVVNGKEIP